MRCVAFPGGTVYIALVTIKISAVIPKWHCLIGSPCHCYPTMLDSRDGLLTAQRREDDTGTEQSRHSPVSPESCRQNICALLATHSCASFALFVLIKGWSCNLPHSPLYSAAMLLRLVLKDWGWNLQPPASSGGINYSSSWQFVLCE